MTFCIIDPANNKPITVSGPDSITQCDLTRIAEEEIKLWHAKKKHISEINMTMDDEDLIIKATERSPIIRVRRITGYLSNLENFNESKLAEERARRVHKMGSVREARDCDNR